MTGADLVARVRALGMTSVLWNDDPFDWRTPGTPAIVARVGAALAAAAKWARTNADVPAR